MWWVCIFCTVKDPMWLSCLSSFEPCHITLMYAEFVIKHSLDWRVQACREECCCAFAEGGGGNKWERRAFLSPRGERWEAEKHGYIGREWGMVSKPRREEEKEGLGWVPCHCSAYCTRTSWYQKATLNSSARPNLLAWNITGTHF